MSKVIKFVLAGGLFVSVAVAQAEDRGRPGKFRRLPVKVYGDKMKAAWIGQIRARKTVVAESGKIAKDNKGREVFVIPVKIPKPGKIEQSWAPGPVKESKFTEAEMKKITVDRKK